MSIHTITLTNEQEIGIAEEASHNNKTVEEYLQWRIEQYATLGNSRLIKTQVESVVSKLYAGPPPRPASPSIILTVNEITT